MRSEHTGALASAMFPFMAKRRMMRQWGGTADISMDGNAIMGPSPVKNLTLNAGWGYSGFKATPAVGCAIADTVATGRTHPLIAAFCLARFESVARIDYAGVGPAPLLPSYHRPFILTLSAVFPMFSAVPVGLASAA